MVILALKGMARSKKRRRRYAVVTACERGCGNIGYVYVYAKNFDEMKKKYAGKKLVCDDCKNKPAPVVWDFTNKKV